MKARFLALAALVLGLASCQTEPEGLDVNVGGEVDTVVTLSLPETTRANSALGAFDNVDWTKYTIRYQMKIYDSNGRVSDAIYETYLDGDKGKSVTFPVRLVPNRDYSFVAWADIVKDNDYSDLHYNTEDLTNITLNDTWVAMDETRDAFTDVETLKYFGNTPINLQLIRPFAKLRVVTTDMVALNNLDIVPTKATVEYTVDHYNAFNALAGKVIADSKNRDIKHEEFSIKSYGEDVLHGADMTLFTDYFFAKSEEEPINFILTVYDQDGVADENIIKTNNFNTPIPAQRNYLTTIQGNVLTDGNNVKVTVDKDGAFADEKVEKIVEVGNATDLQEAINEADEDTTVVLGGDIDLGDLFGASILSTRAAEPTCGLLIPADNKVVLDLKGYTISQAKTQTGAYAMIDNKGTLTIEDSSANKSGKIAYGDNGNGGNYVSNTISNSGVLTINGGTIENNSSATVASNGYPHPIDNSGVLTINGGTFKNNANYSSMRIWCTTDDNTIVTINGGTFNGSIDFQTPNGAANKGTLTINGGTFNADTYTKCSVRLLGFGADVDEMNGYISGGQFNGAIALKNWSGSELNSKVFNITGGTFTVDPSEFVDDDYKVVENNGVWTVELRSVIAKVGDAEYRTLAKAVAAVENGGTIVLTTDVEQVDGVIVTDKNITIDLNTKTFTVSEGANTNNRNFKVNGSSVVTIKNGTMVAAGNYSSGAYGTLRTEGTANVTLEGVKLYNYRGNGLNVKALSGTTVTINDSEIYSQYGGGVEAAGGTVKLTNVKIEQKGMYTAPYNSMAISVNGGGTATVNSGTYSTECLTAEEANNQGTSHGPWCAGVLNSGGTLIINGGTFSNDNFGDNALATHARGLLLADTAANIQINGGTFNAVKAIIDMTNNLGDASRNPSATLSGGDFSADPCVSGLYASHLISVAEDFKVENNNGRWTVVRKPDVAKIGEVGYTSLAKAVAAVEDGDTITLVANEVFTEKNYYDNGGWKDGLGYAGDKSFTIDLNGYTISQNGALNDYLIWIKNDGSKANTITLKNGTLDAGTTAYCAFATASSNKQKITINFENLNLVGNNSNGAVAKIRGGSELNVKAGTVITGKNNYVGIEAVGNNTVVNIYEGAEIYQNGTSNYVAAIVGASYNATMNIYGGYGKSAKCGIIVMSTGATINVSGGEWIANNDGTVATDNRAVLVSQNNRYETGWACKSILNVTGGTFKGGYNCYGMGPGVEPDDAQINIKGGNFNADPKSYVVAGYKAVDENGRWAVVVDPVAKIGDTEYDTLSEAFNVGGNITLLRDVTVAETVVLAEGKTVVLDLNGKTLSGTMHKNDGAVVKNEGTLTVKNGTVKSTANNGGSAIANYGTLTIDNATINGAPREGESWPSYPINNYSNATVTNSVVTGYQGCLALNNAGTTTINDCNFTKNYEKTSSHVFYVNHADAKVVINGGTYNHNGFDGSLAYINKGEVTINAGTFNAKDGGYGVAVLSGGKVTVNGGTLPAFLNWGGQIIDNRTK